MSGNHPKLPADTTGNGHPRRAVITGAAASAIGVVAGPLPLMNEAVAAAKEADTVAKPEGTVASSTVTMTFRVNQQASHRLSFFGGKQLLWDDHPQVLSTENPS